MLKKTDLLLLLSQLEETDEVKKYKAQLITSLTIPLDIIKYINDIRPMEIADFYRVIRKSYNSKKSKLYGNIVKEIEEPKIVLTTLSSLITQILLYSSKLDNADRLMFLSHSRANEIASVLNLYFRDYDLVPCLNLLKLIKADIKAFESTM